MQRAFCWKSGETSLSLWGTQDSRHRGFSWMTLVVLVSRARDFHSPRVCVSPGVITG